MKQKSFEFTLSGHNSLLVKALDIMTFNDIVVDPYLLLNTEKYLPLQS